MELMNTKNDYSPILAYSQYKIKTSSKCDNIH